MELGEINSVTLSLKIILVHIFYINFRAILSINEKKNLMLSLYISLGRIDIFIVLSILIHKHGISFHLFRSCLFSYIQCFAVFSLQVLKIFC